VQRVDRTRDHRTTPHGSQRFSIGAGATRVLAVDRAAGGDDRYQCGRYFLVATFFLPATVRLGPLRVRALVFVR
jgi:hypothetical protein